MPPFTSSPDSDLPAQVDAYLSHPRFHHKLHLPASASHALDLEVTYSVVGTGSDDIDEDGKITDHGASSKIPTIIWAGAMFATRWQGTWGHWLAKEKGVRVVYVDRPGFGGSTPVTLNQRIPVWLETIPHLMQALNVKHVVLASQSAGTIFQMNALYHLRDILSPTNPYIAFFGPWVHPEHSGVTLLSVAKLLPGSWISRMDQIQGFMIKNINPTIGFSSGLLSSLSSAILPQKSATQKQKAEEEEAKKIQAYGLEEKERDLVDAEVFRRALSEGTKGIGDEAFLCLKKVPAGENNPISWGPAEDYDAFVKSIAERERRRISDLQQSPQSGESPNQERLKVDAFFGETDFMIGKKGDKYFRDCWNSEEVRDVISWEGTVIEGSDHDTVVQCWRGGLGKAFEEARKSLVDEEQ